MPYSEWSVVLISLSQAIESVGGFLSLWHGQYNARPTVVLYKPQSITAHIQLGEQRHMRVNNLPGVVCEVEWPIGSKSNALTTTPPPFCHAFCPFCHSHWKLQLISPVSEANAVNLKVIVTVMLLQVFEHEATVRVMAGACPARGFERHNNSTLRRRHRNLSAGVTADSLKNSVPGSKFCHVFCPFCFSSRL